MGAAAAASRSKVSNISNFCETCCGNFFVAAQFRPPRALISGKKMSKKSRLLRKTVEYS